MAGMISCDCGYQGIGLQADSRLICPICHEPEVTIRTWRIPCPGGHLFEVREEWLGREMICPKCDAAFVPAAADSLEHQEAERLRREEAEARLARRWLTIAIGAAVVLVLLLIVLTTMSIMRG